MAAVDCVEVEPGQSFCPSLDVEAVLHHVSVGGDDGSDVEESRGGKSTRALMRTTPEAVASTIAFRPGRGIPCPPRRARK
jgi:hypothetical protein